jgi:hypothetical protein
MSEGVQAVLIILTVFIAIGGIAFIIFSIDKNNEERKKIIRKNLAKNNQRFFDKETHKISLGLDKKVKGLFVFQETNNGELLIKKGKKSVPISIDLENKNFFDPNGYSGLYGRYTIENIEDAIHTENVFGIEFKFLAYDGKIRIVD